MFTPSTTSSFTAGFVLNAILWSLLVKIESLAKLIWLDGFVNSDRILGWINENRLVSFALAKFINLGLHGLNTLGVSMALGGSLVDALMCWVVVPRIVKSREKIKL